jgi:Cu-processing system permease protein
MKAVWLTAKTVLVEALRRREVYAIVLMAVVVIVAAGAMRFFDTRGADRFFRDMALKTMNIATALTMIVLAARQLPREFERRTIYPLLAKPVSRSTFMVGKFVGVLLSGFFCYAIFMMIFMLGVWWIGRPLNWVLFLQATWLQLLGLTLIAALAFMLSLVMNLDAAITVTMLFFILANTYSSILTSLYHRAGELGKLLLLTVNFAVPQLTLFDMSGKVVHQQAWDALPARVMLQLTAYGSAYVILFLLLAWLIFRRKQI